MDEKNAAGQGRRPVFTAKKVMRALSLLCIVFVFCPSFLVSCSGQDMDISAMTAVKGISMYGEKVVEPHPVMLVSLLLPAAVFVLLIIKKWTDKKTAGITAACSAADFAVWLIFRAAVKNAAEENYCSFKTTGWYALNIIALLLLILLSGLAAVGKMEMDGDLAALFAGGGIQNVLGQMSDAAGRVSDAVTSMAGSAAGVNHKKQGEAAGTCAKCGSPLAYGSRFCPSCGTQVPEIMPAEEAVMQGMEKTAEPQEKKEAGRETASKAAAPDEGQPGRKSGAVPVKIFAGAGVAAVLLIAVICMAVKSGSTVDLNDYLTITADGYDGYGTARADIDWDALEEKYGEKLSFTGRAREEYGGFVNMMTPAEAMQDYVRVRLDLPDGLSNGDKITYTWEVDDEELLSYVKCRIKYKDGTYSVSGLEEVGTFDAFDGLEVLFSGVAPDGSADLSYNGTELGYYDFVCDKTGGLNNGDTVTVSLDSSKLEYCAENFGKVPEILEKKYTVEGLNSYISEISEISAEGLESMQKQASDVYRAYVARDWEEDALLESLTYIGGYLLTAKEPDPYRGNHNILCLVYKAQARNVYSNEGESYNKVKDVYWYLSFSNLMAGPDGELTVNMADYSTPDAGFTVDSGISNGWWRTRSWYYKGYETLDALYKDVVTASMDVYNHEDHVDESAAPAAPAEEADTSAGEGYIFPDSDTELLTAEDLEGLSAEECKTARNEIYARHGRRFRDEAVQAYFDSCSWYEGTVEPDDFEEGSLSDTEIANRDRIVAYEEEKGYR